MLLLSFHIGKEPYALPVRQIREILPLTRINPLPHAPTFVAGLLNFRGDTVPVIDLCQLLEQRSYARVLSTRIILVDYTDAGGQTRPLGLIAEQVTNTFEIRDDDISANGVSLKDAPYLGEIINDDGVITHIVGINQLLTEQAQSILYADTPPTNRAQLP
jgi:chemotaxis-related protein WspB